MEKTKADLEETRKNLKSLTKYVIGHLEALLEKYGPHISAPDHEIRRHEEVDAKAWRSRRSRSLTTARPATSATRFPARNSSWNAPSSTRSCSCSRTALTRSANCRRNCSSGQELFYCGLPERERVFTCAYTDRDASYLKRFTFGGTILNKAYLCIPDKSRILFFAPDTPKILYVRYKPAPHQKIIQQTCEPGTGRGQSRRKRAAGRFPSRTFRPSPPSRRAAGMKKPRRRRLFSPEIKASATGQ